MSDEKQVAIPEASQNVLKTLSGQLDQLTEAYNKSTSNVRAQAHMILRTVADVGGIDLDCFTVEVSPDFTHIICKPVPTPVPGVAEEIETEANPETEGEG